MRRITYLFHAPKHNNRVVMCYPVSPVLVDILVWGERLDSRQAGIWPGGESDFSMAAIMPILISSSAISGDISTVNDPSLFSVTSIMASPSGHLWYLRGKRGTIQSPSMCNHLPAWALFPISLSSRPWRRVGIWVEASPNLLGFCRWIVGRLRQWLLTNFFSCSNYAVHRAYILTDIL